MTMLVLCVKVALIVSMVVLIVKKVEAIKLLKKKLEK